MAGFRQIKELPGCRVAGWTVVLAALALGGCAWISEETKFGMQRDWERFKGYDYGDATARLTGFSELFPSPSQQEVANEEKICMHPNTRTRVLVQDGVSDEVEYRQCPLAPYSDDMGQRMGRRPDW